MKIIIIGTGNVATNLAAAFARKGINAPMVSSREGLDRIDPSADVYFYCVSDNALAEVISQVHVSPRALHLHTSGTVPNTVFGPDKPHCGIFYMIYSFSKEHIIEDFGQVPVFIIANGIDDTTAIYALAQNLTSRIYEVKPSELNKLHVAGVFANNFANLMFALAKDMLKGTSIPFEALLPIIDTTAAKVHTLTPREAQTGPAARGDINVIEHHIQLLPSKELRDLYLTLSRLINPHISL